MVLNIFPSVDTGVCAASVRRFNEIAAGLDNATVVCVSADLPFALNRFCGAEGIENVVAASSFRSGFGYDYGVRMENGGFAGLLARAVVVIDADGTVAHTEVVPSIGQEPDYDAAIAALAEALDARVKPRTLRTSSGQQPATSIQTAIPTMRSARLDVRR